MPGWSNLGIVEVDVKMTYAEYTEVNDAQVMEVLGIISSMTFQARIVKTVISFSAFVKTEPSLSNLAKKRENFKKTGRWMKPERGTSVKRLKIAGVNVDEIVNSEKCDRLILYIHGGGFVYGGNQVHLHMLSMLSRLASARILAVDYRLSPEHPYPTAMNEVLAVYKKLIERGEQDIVIAGDSAGGSLAIACTLNLRDEKLQLPSKVIVLSPATDCTFSNEWMTINAGSDPIISKDKLEFFINAYAPNTPRKSPEISSFFADVKGLPPLLLHVAEGEVLYGDSYLLHKKIVESGGDSKLFIGKDLWHAWHIFTRYVPESRQAIAEVATFLKNSSPTGVEHK